MFCELVDSDRLANRLDPEDWTEVLSGYYEVCRAVIHRFDGHVASELADGLLAYFGWPVAHEDDPRRAVQTGLAMIDALRDLDARLRRKRGIALHARVSIDTSTVVVDAGDGRAGEHAWGSALNIASRLLSVANPDAVVISQTTLDLVRGYFTFEDLGPHNLKNIGNAVRVYQVLGESGANTRVDALGERGLTPLIGREVEVGTLLRLWDSAVRGHSQTVEISGEPGIGKSRLVKAVSDRIPNTIVFRCSEINSGSALFPITSRLERLLEFDQLEDPGQKLDRLEQRLQGLGFSPSDVVPLIASELSIPLLDRFPSPDLTVPQLTIQKKRQRTLTILMEWVLREAQRQPVVVVWEDLHWADPSTLELIGLIIERASTTPLLNVLTFRPHFQPPWPAPASLTELVLTRLDRAAVEKMISKITSGRSLPSEVIEQIVEKTDGVPLFVEELLQAVLVVRSEGDDYVKTRASALIGIPEKLEGWLMSRLDRLGAAKAVAQRAAVLGRTFSQDLLRAVIDADAEITSRPASGWAHVQQCLTQLIEAGVLRRLPSRQVSYEFKHALIQGAARQSLLKRTRHACHLQTAQVLEARFPQVVETQPELVAHHYAEALEFDRAVHYWQLAGERARDRSANHEALQHFARALEALEKLSEGEQRDRRELVLRIASITPLIAVEGYVAEATARTAQRALDLCRTLGDVKNLFPVLYLLWVTRLVSGKYAGALERSEEFSREAHNQQDSAPRLMSHRLRGFSLLMIGDLTHAREHLQRSLDLYDLERHSGLKNQGYAQDPRCACEAFMALVQWLRGYPDEAARWNRLSLEHAEAARHSNTWGYVLCFGGATFEAVRRDVAMTAQRASELLAFGEREGLPVWLAYGRLLHGWALVQSGREDGILEMKTGLIDFLDPSSMEAAPRSLHMAFMKSLLLSLVGEACGKLGRTQEGLAELEAAWCFAEASGEAFWKAEVLRLKGELLLQADGAPDRRRQEAEACFLKAIETASVQGARALQLRAAISLSRLWGAEKPFDARRNVAEAYNGFTEGFDSVDLQQARQLLHELPTV